MLASEPMVYRDLYMNLRPPRRGVAVRRLRRTTCAARKLGTKLRRMDRYGHRLGGDGPPRGLWDARTPRRNCIMYYRKRIFRYEIGPPGNKQLNTSSKQ